MRCVNLYVGPGVVSPSAETVMAVAARFGARAVTVEGAVLRANVEQGHRALPAILSGLEAAGVQIESASLARPTLDDVYLHHTGRSFVVDEGAGRPAVVSG